MKIQRLAVENFKSFDRLDLELGDFNVFIGANASGKSNVLHILEFLRDIAASGLRNAVSMQGGVEFLRNVQVGDARETMLASAWKGFSDEISEEEKERSTRVEPLKLDQKISLLYENEESYRVQEDQLGVSMRLFDIEDEQNEKELGDIEYMFFNDAGAVNLRARGEVKGETFDETGSQSLSGEEDSLMSNQSIPSGESLVGSPPQWILNLQSKKAGRKGFSSLSIYDFDTGTQRKAAPITGKSDLEEDGSNVALVLKNLLDDDEKRRRFTNLIQYVLPFVSDVDVERFAGRSLIPTLEETHTPGTPLPASLLSEGTIKVISLLIALYFEEKPVIAFEEPASNLHPQLISRVVEMMKEQSGGEDGKQIFVTTHSPEVIKHAGLEHVYLVSRDDDGFSTVSKPAEKEEVAIFLENEMGLDDLFVQGLLDI